MTRPQDDVRMGHPFWRRLLPRLRDRLDALGLEHVRIKQETDFAPMTLEEIRADYGTLDVGLDEYVGFEPMEKDWRIYRVAGAPADERWLGRAERWDDQQTPMLSWSGHAWEMCFGQGQGAPPPDAFADDDAFLDAVVDYLSRHFASRVFTVGVRFGGGGHAVGRT